jgi:hypothetical protein
VRDAASVSGRGKPGHWNLGMSMQPERAPV